MANGALSRRDRLIVARHEVPGREAENPVPEGTVEVISPEWREDKEIWDVLCLDEGETLGSTLG
jgi:hypothetical protein